MSSLTPNARAELIKQHLKSGGAIKGTRTYPHPFTYTLLDHGGATVDTFTETGDGAACAGAARGLPAGRAEQLGSPGGTARPLRARREDRTA